MRFIKLFFWAALPLFGTVSHADDVIDKVRGLAACPQVQAEEPLATEYGSSGFMKNLAESADSIRAIAARLLQAALAPDNDDPNARCRPQCENGEIAEVIYRVAPVAFLADDKQNAECIAFEDQTRDDPMRFDSKSFASVTELNEWIMAFSQGRGDDGKALYARCSSNCSPRYTFVIAAQDTGFKVDTEVLCGLARDKANDKYLISTAVRHTCAVN